MADYLSTYGLTTWFDIGQTTAASWQLVMLEWKKAFCAASDSCASGLQIFPTALHCDALKCASEGIQRRLNLD